MGILADLGIKPRKTKPEKRDIPQPPVLPFIHQEAQPQTKGAEMAKKALALTKDADRKQPYIQVGSYKLALVVMGQLQKIADIPSAAEALYPEFVKGVKESGWSVSDAIHECQRLFGSYERKGTGYRAKSAEEKAEHQKVRKAASLLVGLAPDVSPDKLVKMFKEIAADTEILTKAAQYLQSKPRSKDGYLLLRNR